MTFLPEGREQEPLRLPLSTAAAGQEPNDRYTDALAYAQPLREFSIVANKTERRNSCCGRQVRYRPGADIHWGY